MRKTRRRPFTKETVDSLGSIPVLQCYIGGEPWQYGLVTAEQMAKLTETEDAKDEDTAAICRGVAQQIFVQVGEITHTNVIHELGHAYMSMSCVQSADLDTDQVEEVMCDILAHHWCRILLLSRIMVHNLLCLEDYNRGNKNQDWMECPHDVLDRRMPENLLELIATYAGDGGLNPLLKARIAKKKRRKRF